MSNTEHSCTEEIKITADKLVETIKTLIHEGNVRHIVIKNEQGQTVIEIPVSVGVIGALMLPVFAAVGAIAVYAADYTIVVTRDTPPETQAQ